MYRLLSWIKVYKLHKRKNIDKCHTWISIIKFDPTSTVEYFENIWNNPTNRLHTLRVQLFALPLNKLFKLVEDAKVNPKRGDFEFESMFSIIHSISKQRLYKPVEATWSPPIERKFLKLNFVNKGIEYLNISNP